MGNEVTGTVNEQDGTIAIKGADGTEIRYVKESDLLAVKGSRVSKEDAAKEVEAAKATILAESNSKIEAERQKVLLAEARVQSLQEQAERGGGSAAELARAQADLVAAKNSGEVLGSKYLELKRNIIVQTYNVPLATVEKKNLQDLELFEEALKAVIGDKKIGNFAVGGGGGGANPNQGKSPIDLARAAYSSK